MRAAPLDVPLSEEDLRRERQRARALRNTQWWKNLRGRGICHYCRRRVPPRALTMDHIVPLIRGGKTSKSNVVPSCKPCNDLKGNLIPSEWDAYLERLAGRKSDS